MRAAIKNSSENIARETVVGTTITLFRRCNSPQKTISLFYSSGVTKITTLQYLLLNNFQIYQIVSSNTARKKDPKSMNSKISSKIVD